jgi:hypothetical protein
LALSPRDDGPLSERHRRLGIPPPTPRAHDTRGAEPHEVPQISDLKIEIVARDELGSIVALITPDGVVDAQTASAEIARGDVTYVTGPDSYVRVPVRAISTIGGAYLYANWDGSRRNNLHDLSPLIRVLTPATPATLAAADEAAPPTLRERGAARWSQLVRSIRMHGPIRPRPVACVDCPPLA